MTTGTFYLLWGGYRGKKKLLSAFKTLRKGSPLRSQTRKEQKIRPLALKYGLCTIKTIKPKHFYSPVNSHSRLATQPTCKPNREVRRKIQQHRMWKPVDYEWKCNWSNREKLLSDTLLTLGGHSWCRLYITLPSVTGRQNVNMPGTQGPFSNKVFTNVCHIKQQQVGAYTHQKHGRRA